MAGAQAQPQNVAPVQIASLQLADLTLRQRVLDDGFDLHWVKPIDPAQARSHCGGA